MIWYTVSVPRTRYGFRTLDRICATDSRKKAFEEARKTADAEGIAVQVKTERPLSGGRGLTCGFYTVLPRA